MTTTWEISTDRGVGLRPEQLVAVLAAHHERVLEGWQTLTSEQWSSPSRNADWSVHETARHVADCLEVSCAGILGRPTPRSIEGFQPRTTPLTWLEASANEPPEGTIERFASMAPAYRERVGERLADGDDTVAPMVYGPTHWSIGVVHVFWDSWIHERDILVPLDRPVDSTDDERRLASLYALLMTFVPSLMTGRDARESIAFTGRGGHTVTATAGDGRLSSAASIETTTLEAELGALVDALSGRGTPLRELLPDAPEGLDFFASIMTG